MTAIFTDRWTDAAWIRTCRCASGQQVHRDLFDVKFLLENEGFSEEVKKGFLLCLAGGDRPFHEVIRPNFQDQRDTMKTKFEGMSDEIFSYEDFENTREGLVKTIHVSLTDKGREFLLSFKNLTPDWSIYDFGRFLAVQWKLQNLKNLKAENSKKHLELSQALKKKLRVKNAFEVRKIDEDYFSE